MPLGAARLTLLAFQPTVAVGAEVIRKKVGIFSNGVDIATADSKFGGSSIFVNNTSSTDNVEIDDASNTQFRLGSTFTIEGWFKPGLTGDRFWSFKGVNTSNGFGLGISSNWIIFRHAGTTDLKYSRSDSNWQHIAFVSDGTNKQIYYNGSQVATTTATLNITDTTNLRIGNELTNSTFGYYGYIDEVRISNTARYTGSYTIPTAPFVNDDNTLLLLHMNGTDGSTYFEDDNGVGRSAVGVSALGNAQVDTAQSKFGGASATFDGTGDYLQVPYSSDFHWNSGDFTIEFWIRTNSTHSSTVPPTIGMMNPTTGLNYWSFGVDNNNLLEFYYFNGSTVSVVGSTTISTAVWHHVAMTYRSSNNTIKLWLNGTNEVSATVSGTPQFTTYGAIPVTIGQYNNVGFNGHLDEIRISNTRRYTSNFTTASVPHVNDSNTLLLLHMDGSDTSTDFRDDNGKDRYPLPIQALSDTQISTTASKFGGTSIKFVTSGSYAEVVAAESPAFGSGEFTIEFWLYYTAIPTTAASMLWDQRPGSNGAYPLIWTEGNSKANINYFVSSSARIATGAVLSANTWHHVAITRDSSADHKCYVDGVKQGATWNSTTSYLAGRLRIGANMNGVNIVPGYMDEIRASSVCRYTAAFTPPSAPFQNDADTILLLHGHGSNTNTFLLDDNGFY